MTTSKNIFIVLVTISVLPFGIASARAECTLWRTWYEYPCIEYYPNGKDCWKADKVQKQECIQFEVDVSGKDTVNYPSPQSKSKPDDKLKREEENKNK